MSGHTVNRCETANLKCPGCNYEVQAAFYLDNETVCEDDQYHDGNCADCLFDILERKGATVNFGDSKGA